MKLSRLLLACSTLPLAASASIVIDDSSWSSPATNAYVGGSSGINYYGSSSSTGNLSLTGASSNLLTLTTGTSGRGLSVSFPQQTLVNVGDTLSATITFQIAGPILTSTSNNFRVGLYDNTGGTPISGNNYGNTNAIFEGWTGYLFASSIDTGDTTPSGVYKKLTTQQYIIGSNQNMPLIGEGGINNAPGDTSALVAGVNYTASMVLKSTASGLHLAYSLTGGSLGSEFNFTAEDLDLPNLSFTTLAFHVNSNTWDTSQLQSVNVVYTAVPEPSTYAALLAGGLLGIVLLRRRRR